MHPRTKRTFFYTSLGLILLAAFLYVFFVLPPPTQSFPIFRTLYRTIESKPSSQSGEIQLLEKNYHDNPGSEENLGALLIAYCRLPLFDESYQKQLTELVNTFIKAYPSRAEGFHAKSLLSLQKQNPQDALANIEKAALIQPDNKELRLLKLKAQLEKLSQQDPSDRGGLSKLLKETEAILQKDPTQPQALEAKGIAHFLLQEPDLAKKTFEQKLRVSPDDPVSFYYLGLIDERSDAYESAKNWFQETLRFSPNHALARLKLAQIYLFSEASYDLAERHLRDLLTRYKPFLPQDRLTATELCLIHCLLMQGKEKEASLFMTSLQFNSQQVNAQSMHWMKKWHITTKSMDVDTFHYVLGLSQMEEKNFDGAIRAFQVYLEKHPEDYETLMHLSSLLVHKKDYKAASAYAEKIASELEFLQPEEIHSDLFLQKPAIDWKNLQTLTAGNEKELRSSASLSTVASIIHRHLPSGQFLALKTLSEATNSLPTIDYLWIHNAILHLAQNDYARVERELRTALQINPKNNYAIYFRALMEKKTNATEKSKRDFESIAQDPRIGHKALYELGQLFVKTDLPRARGLWRKALQQQPFYTPAWLSLLKNDKD